MEKERIIIAGLIFFIFFLSAEADVCEDTTLIYGKVYFQGYYSNSQVINATLEIWNNDPDNDNSLMLSYDNTNATGWYSMNISKNMTSLNQTFYIRAKWSDEKNNITWDYKKINISCGNSQQVNFEVQKLCKSPAQINVAIKKKLPNGTTIDMPGENTSIVLNFYPKGSGNFIITMKGKTNPEGNTTLYKASIGDNIFYVENTRSQSYDWPTYILIGAEPFNNHYYRYWNSFTNSYVNYLNTSVKCQWVAGNINFYAFDRKNTTENCTYDDECLSNTCYNGKCAVNCMKGDINDDSVIDIFDVGEILNRLAYGTNIKEECADVNEDGFVDLSDALALIQGL